LFVVQQHAARRMHWDLRLDIEGVLVSWAVPRGPSMDPKDRRLAVQTEDHPIEYADFEGLLPAGNYGAGAMLVWDRGTYCTIDQTGALQGLRNGKIDVQFRGQKLRGRWTLVRTKGGAAQDWLLLHKAEPGTAAVVDLVVQQPWSVYSGLTIDEVAAGIDRTAALRDVALQSGGKLRSPDATLLRPMLAQPGPLPTNAGWHFELKYDGMRVIAAADTAREVRLVGRSGRDATGLFPELTAA
jgi:bifunctional non-homologous end joining protein LigD